MILLFLFFMATPSTGFVQEWINKKSIASLHTAVDDKHISSVVLVPFQFLSFESTRICSIIFERFRRYLTKTTSLSIRIPQYNIPDGELLLEDTMYKQIDNIIGQHIISGKVIQEKGKWYLYVYLLSFVTDTQWNLLWQKKMRLTQFWDPSTLQETEVNSQKSLELCLDQDFSKLLMKDSIVSGEQGSKIVLKTILFRLIYSFSKQVDIEEYHGRENILQGLSLWNRPKDMRNYFQILLKTHEYTGILETNIKFCYAIACIRTPEDKKWFKKGMRLLKKLLKSEYVQIRSISHLILGFVYHSEKNTKASYTMFQKTIIINPLNNDQVILALEKLKKNTFYTKVKQEIR